MSSRPDNGKGEESGCFIPEFSTQELLKKMT